MNRLIRSFGFAIEGIKTCFRQETNMRIHFFSAVFVVVLGFFLKVNHCEWIILVICIGIVICMEMVNTAIEQLCNEITTNLRLSIKVIKDIAAGAVLISAGTSAMCGAIIFLPKIFSLFKNIL